MRRSARRIGIFAASLPIVVSCSRSDAGGISGEAVAQPSAAVWTQQTAWRLSREPALQIAGSDEIVEEAALDPVRVFRAPDGQYVVGDGDQNGWHALQVYDERGKYVAQYGREGRGPGEFTQLFTWAGNYRGDSVAAYDFGDRSLEIFSREEKFGRAIKLPQKWPKERPPHGTRGHSDIFIGPFADGRIIRFEASLTTIPSGEGPAWYEPELVVYDANGEYSRSLGKRKTWAWWWNGKNSNEYPFQPFAITVAGRDVWYHGIADSFVVQVFDTDGRARRTVRRSFTRLPVTAQDP